MTEHRTDLPRQQVRRFDVFAEVKRLEALAEGRPEDEAKGYGIWVAKVVAGRRFGRATGERPERQRVRQEGDDAAGDRRDGRFKHAGDELQTDRTFDQEIIDRMGATFYDRVFAPAVRAAVEGGARYEEFRDTIRADWKPPRPSTKRSSASESRPSQARN
jgi:hypothetical protein